MMTFFRKVRFFFGTSLGRKGLIVRLVRRLNPLTMRAGGIWRRTALRRVRVVAVTGTFGKTTTSRAASAALGARFRFYMDLNAKGFVALALLRAKPWWRHAVIETGISRPGQMRPLARMIRPDAVIVTSIGSEHIASFRTQERTRAEKAELLRALPSDGVAILNGDDPRTSTMDGFTTARIVRFGVGPGNDIRAENITLDWPAGTRLDLIWMGERREAWIPLLGAPGINASLAAAAAALTGGESLDAVVERLRRIRPKGGRLEPILLPNGAYLLRDDFKGSVESYDVAFDLFAQVPARRRIVLMGEFSEGSEGRPRDIMRHFGERAAQCAEVLVFYGSKKAAQAYRSGAKGGGMKPENILHSGRSIPDCIAVMRGLLQPGDVALVKSRREFRLDRVVLALMGREVRCTIPRCTLSFVRCATCSMLEGGWAGHPELAGLGRRMPASAPEAPPADGVGQLP